MTTRRDPLEPLSVLGTGDPSSGPAKEAHDRFHVLMNRDLASLEDRIYRLEKYYVDLADEVKRIRRAAASPSTSPTPPLAPPTEGK